jgi:hypothetical protein
MDLSFSSGIESLDNVLGNIRKGDNCVWQVDNIKHYQYFVNAFVRKAAEDGKEIIYFRFAQHEYLIPDDVKIVEYKFSLETGFENFLIEILDIIDKHGVGGCYVFDSLSVLAADWNCDRLLGCFFMLVCPHLYKLDTVAYFAIIRNVNGPLAIDIIHDTAQVVIDVYAGKDDIYIQPIKVKDRYSPTLYMLHICRDDVFMPETRSYVVSKILGGIEQPWLNFNIDRPGIWTNIIINAKRLHEQLESGNGSFQSGVDVETMRKKLIRMMITVDKSVFELSYKYLDLSDLLAIAKRMIGTGLVGGKSVGMLLAQSIMKKIDPKWKNRLESHDSFFIGSDVFYTYIIQNNCWWDLRHIKRSTGDFSAASEFRRKIQEGHFPKDIEERFKLMLNFYGQSPIIVRSSSLLEDAYGNAFSGKYESYFCVNRGTPEERMAAFIQAVKNVYASTMNEDALAYRLHKGLLDKEECMGLLVQRVSGNFHEHSYFPQIAGVGYSFNPFAWNNKIDPSQGVLRMVFGLGTRAVEQHAGDHTRIVAINQPLLRPESGADQIGKYSQKIIDILNFNSNQPESVKFSDIAGNENIPALSLFASKDEEMLERARQMNVNNVFPWILTFEKLLTSTKFIQDMGEILKTLETAYRHPVDIEYSANFVNEEEYRINILQCRPFHFTGDAKELAVPQNINDEDILLRTFDPLLGQSKYDEIGKIIYIEPEKYSSMSMQDRYAVARLIGKITNHFSHDDNILLIGPGRWGTAMPSLGIPVNFNEIKHVSVLCELGSMHENLSPDISLGTHFFNDLVEMQIMYMSMNMVRSNNLFNRRCITGARNMLADIIPDCAAMADAVFVINTSSIKQDYSCYIHADAVKQKGMVFFRKEIRT